MQNTNVFHEGELRAQLLAGEEKMAEQNGTMIRTTIMSGALSFIGQQTMAVLSIEDKDGRLWCSLIFGKRGFLMANQKTLQIDLKATVVAEGDKFWSNFAVGTRVGVLVIDLATRRRIRINGSVSAQTDEALEIEVNESYPNCPKYITRRRFAFGERVQLQTESRQGTSLEREQIRLIQAADTLFIASAHPARGLDASHRGGLPGFVEVQDERTLRIADYAGNGMFNTLGNLLVDPRAGITFVDFARNTILQATGSVEVFFDEEDAEGRSGGTNRFWIFHVTDWVEAAMPVGLKIEYVEYSPFNPVICASV